MDIVLTFSDGRRQFQWAYSPAHASRLVYDLGAKYWHRVSDSAKWHKR